MSSSTTSEEAASRNVGLSHSLGKHELKGPSRRYVFVCLCECVNTIEMKLQPSVGR